MKTSRLIAALATFAVSMPALASGRARDPKEADALETHRAVREFIDHALDGKALTPGTHVSDRNGHEFVVNHDPDYGWFHTQFTAAGSGRTGVQYERFGSEEWRTERGSIIQDVTQPGARIPVYIVKVFSFDKSESGEHHNVVSGSFTRTNGVPNLVGLVDIARRGDRR